MKKVFRKLNITAFFIFFGCTGYVQALDVAINKPWKNRISELADLAYEKDLDKWKKGTYTVGERRIMLTHWVGQAWREFHQENPDLIRQTFRDLGLSLAVDGSEDTELKFRDISNIEVGDWRLIRKEVEPDDPVEIDEPTSEMTADKGEVEYDLMGEDDHSENDPSENGDSEEDIDQNDDQEEV